MIRLTKEQEQSKEVLDNLAKKQSFRCAIGKSKWIEYKEFNPNYNLREILNNEIVIEFDCKDQNTGWLATNFTAINLYKAGYSFQIWDHGGRSPHIHIHDLPISHLDKQKRSLFKKVFIRKYVPREYLMWVDTSLCGIHLVRLEWTPCWKGKYGVKKLIYNFKQEKTQ